MRRGLGLCLCWAVLLLGSCSTRRSTGWHRAWHSFKLRYNVLYNAEEAFRNLRQEQIREDCTYYRLALPLDIYTSDYEESYQALGEKLERAILRHSLRQKLPKQQQAYKGQIESNPVMYRAWTLLAEAQFYAGSLSQAEQSFAHIRWLYKGDNKVYNYALMWQCRCLIALGRSSDADILLLDLVGREPKPKTTSYRLYQWLSAELALAKGDYPKALAPIEYLARREQSPALKARLYYALAILQHYGLGAEVEAKQALKKVLSYTREPSEQERMRQSFAHSKSLALQLPGLDNTFRPSNTEQAPRLSATSDSLATIYPIDWLRVYEGASNTKPKQDINLKASDGKELILSVQASEVELGEWLFLLSSYHFKHFTQLPLQIELLSPREGEVHQVRILGFRLDSELSKYTAKIRSVLPPLSSLSIIPSE